MQIIPILVESIFLGAICAIPGLIADSYLVKKGVIRPGNKSIILGISILGLIVVRSMFPQMPLWIGMIVATFSVPSGAIQGDLWRTLRRGRWWWVDQSK